MLTRRPNILYNILATLPNRLISSQESNILFETFENAGKIILNRPKALNSLNISMTTRMLEQLREWEKTKSLVIVKGSGEKAFCAGGDVKIGLTSKAGTAFFRSEYKVIYLISKYKIPYVSLIDGYTMGAGLGISVPGKYRIATENTIVSMPENKIGLCPDVGGTYFLPRLKSMIGFYLGLTGELLQGYDAVTAGLATHFVPSQYLNEFEKELSNCSSEEEINTLLSKFSESSEEFSLEPYVKHIEFCFSAQTVEEILERLKTVKVNWSRKTSETLNRLCPGSLKVTLRALKTGSHLNLKECLQMEYRLTSRVRAVLVDKDKNPKWNPSSLSEVTEEYVDGFFVKLPEENELQL
ncbi:3-hydroxyisobutyryl-coenzyme A hydrolase [Operophtera brumata]|uniref:3-hydroxyisobutyryl-CoA hydrolase, mitochondrial n=1 Tax=Operophtera brumata TaxID=104452 RepID=A0A0L7K3Z7_OPEBR|nr:3-hydroxyisobutyryl-coenzyme A hydrolase [Operophtera brumata]